MLCKLSSTERKRKGDEFGRGTTFWGLATVEEALKFLGRREYADARLVFRGVRDQRWRLAPGLSRLWDLEHKLDGDPDRRKSLKPELVKFERNRLNAFKREAERFQSASEPQNDWQWLAIAQHHRLATRLLDWSENLLVALWFALDDAQPGTDSAVWVLRTTKGDWASADDQRRSPLRIQRTLLYDPPKHLVPRIYQQSGVFSVHTMWDGKKGDGSYDLIPLDLNDRLGKRLTKLVIPARNRRRIQDQLERTLGLSGGRIYPDRFDEVSRSVFEKVRP